MSKRFAEPVSIFVGLGFPRDVNSPLEAYQVLNEWTGARTASHASALEVCRAACGDLTDVESARIIFAEFAHQHGILAPEALDASVARLGDEWLAA